MNDTSLQIIVPVGEPVDVDGLRSIFSDAGIRATVEIEERRIVNLDTNTALVSLFLMTTWHAFIEALAKTTGERAQDRLLEILRKVGSIVKKRKPPSWMGASSGKVAVGRWGPLALRDLQTGIVVTGVSQFWLMAVA